MISNKQYPPTNVENKSRKDVTKRNHTRTFWHGIPVRYPDVIVSCQRD